MSGTPAHTQKLFRFRGDTAAVDDTPTWLADENTNITMTLTTVPFRLRIGIQGGGTGSQNIGKLAWSKNGGSYSTYSAASTGLVAHTSASVSADQTLITTANFRLTAMSGNKIQGRYDNDAVVNEGVTSVGNMELEWGLALVATDLAAGNTLDFRVYSGTTATALTSYDVTPRITIGAGTTTEPLGQTIL